MSLIPWRKKSSLINNGEPFTALQQRINNLFQDFWGETDLEPFRGTFSGAFSPDIDIVDRGETIQVTAELPGLTEKDVEVSLDNNLLTISGEKKLEKEDKDKNYYRLERSYGSFQRGITLPAEVDRNKIDAAFKNGVLTVTLPKTVAAQQSQKKIAVKAG